MQLERVEVRNSTASAISDACTMRPNGNARPSSSVDIAPSRGDPVGCVWDPGATLLTRTPPDPNSAAQVQVSDSRAALEALYPDAPAIP